MCEKCQKLFDVNTNLPYLIPCGHTICEKCLNLLEFKNNKLKCPIDCRVYEVTKDKIPKNEMLIYYFETNKNGIPKYSYQIRECVIEEATFCHMDTRNCFQKLCHFLYILIYVKIILSILNIIFWPFKKIYQLIKKVINLIYIIYLKIKGICIIIINKIRSITLPKIKINCNYYYKIKDKLLRSKLIKTIIKFYKYTMRAPLWVNYIKLMKNLLYESQKNANNICIKIVKIMMAIIAIFFAHLFAYLTSNLSNFFIILVLLNESAVVLMDFMKMNDEKNSKKYIYKKIISKNINKNKGRKSVHEKIKKPNSDDDENEKEYLIDENKYYRGKKCIIRWIGFILYWYFFPILKDNLFNLIKYMEYSKDIDLDSQEKYIKIWTGVINSLLFIPKLLIVIYLTC